MECKDVMEMYNPDVWPVGAFVRRFYESRHKANVIGSNSAALGGQMRGTLSTQGTEAH